MTRVTGIGGIFFKARDPKALQEWYRTHLGLPLEEWGGAVFHWQTPERPEPDGMTVWNVFPAETKYFDPSPAPFMVNFRVDDLDAMLAALRAAGCTVLDRYDETEQGKFGYVQDPEGAVVELWQPAADDAG